MIFYHVLAHIDFFQNNLYFRHTWDYDFTGQALSDKRMIAQLRSEKGRWVDYVIEFARGIDNLVGFHAELSRLNRPPESAAHPACWTTISTSSCRTVRKVKTGEYIKEIERYNACLRESGRTRGAGVFCRGDRKYPEFDALFKKSLEREAPAAGRT